MNEIQRLKRAVRHDPYDLATRLVFADALEEAGRAGEADFERTVVEFARHVLKAIRAHEDDKPVGMRRVCLARLDSGRVNVKLSVLADERFKGNPSYSTVYAYVRRDGWVFRGSWRGPDGPPRFLVHDRAAWARHVGVYGLKYMNEVDG